MLQDDDIEKFLHYFSNCESENVSEPLEEAAVVLEDASGLFAAELWRLSRSLMIASAARLAPIEAAAAAEKIWKSLAGKRCRPLTEVVAWQKALRWAKSQDKQLHSGNVFARQEQVGAALGRLKAKGFDLSVGAYGIIFPDAARQMIFQQADILIALVGGTETLLQICRIMKERGNIHDGMWMMGDQVPNVIQIKCPSIPIGWLVAVAMRHVGKKPKARKPEIAWKTLISIATDLGACLDCERYNQFEGMDMHPAQFWRSLTDSLFWREFFTLPQVPAVALKYLQPVLSKAIKSFGEHDFALLIDAFFNEAADLIKVARSDSPTLLKRSAVKIKAPKLLAHGLGKAGSVNKECREIYLSEKRTDQSLIFFEHDNEHFLVMPTPFLNASICEVIFGTIWEKLPSVQANDVVRLAMELTLADACEGKAPTVLPQEKYTVGKQVFEMDVGSREGDHIVLIETKAKSLTARSRQNAGFHYISDYTKSYLAIIKQLMIHERHIRAGSNPLVTTDETTADFRPLKIAVSPLSYGQLSDKIFASSLVRGLFDATLTPAPGRNDPDELKIVDDFNKAFKSIRTLILELAPKQDGVPQINPYLIDFFWVDLGQALYVLDRAHTIKDAFQPLKHITFSSRDFWTELAFADRGGLTRERWRQLPPSTS